MFGLHIDCYCPAVACRGMNQFFGEPRFLHEFTFFDAMLFGPLFKIEIVQKTNNSPEFLVFAVTEFTSELAHGVFDDFAMFEVEGIRVVFFEEFQGSFACNSC